MQACDKSRESREENVSLQIRQPGLARRLSLGPTSSAEGEEEPRPDGGRRIDLPGQTEHGFDLGFGRYYVYKVKQKGVS